MGRGAVSPPGENGGRGILRDVVQITRPRHWIKNVFVIVPALFGGPPSWQVVLRTVWAFGCFCLLSSGVYCLNDVIDVRDDRMHPRKRDRPVASGSMSAAAALALATLLTTTALVCGAAISGRFEWLCLLYVANSVIYCLWLKHHVIIDVLLIAIGFVLRIMAGCAAMSLRPSSWILVCGFSLAMLLGFGKRRLEIDEAGLETDYRRSLRSYSIPKLNLLLGVTSSVCLLSYMLYTVSPDTIALHRTENLIYTVPLVAYGVFRYLLKVQEGKHDGPVEILFQDPVFALNGLIWFIMVCALLFIPALR